MTNAAISVKDFGGFYHGFDPNAFRFMDIPTRVQIGSITTQLKDANGKPLGPSQVKPLFETFHTASVSEQAPGPSWWQMVRASTIVLMTVPQTVFFSRAHGQGERKRTGKAEGTGNEEKINKKAKYDAEKKKWYEKDQNGKTKWLGPGFQPSQEQLKKAGLAMADGATQGALVGSAGGFTAATLEEVIGILALF